MAITHIIATALRNRLFLAGLFLRLSLILFFIPDIQKELFIPFLVNIIENPSLTTSPWQTFLDNNGPVNAFPYGSIMIAIHLPFVYIGWLLDLLISSSFFTQIGFKFSLFVADVTLLLILVRMFGSSYRKVLIFYWLSPIVIYITYIHGQTDIVPISLFTAALFYLRKTDIRRSAITLALSISAKFSMLITAPFIFLYLIVNKKHRLHIKPFILVLAIAVLAFNIPFIFDTGFQQMVINNDQTERLFSLNIDYSNNITAFVTPLILIIVLYLIWRQERINFDLLMATLLISFFVVILTSIAPPGWYIWLTPFLVQHQIRHGQSAIVATAMFSFVLVLFYLSTTSTGYVNLFDINIEQYRSSITQSITEKQLSLLFTLIIGTGLIIIFQIIKSGIKENNYLHPGNKKLSIGICGGVKSGKNTLANAIEKLFGSHSTCRLSGNNYYKWDSHSPMWKTITPLNPRSSLLMDYTNDSLRLISGHNIYGRLYNPKSGYFSKIREIKSNDVIIVSGFHALFTEHLRSKLDLKIFIEINKELRSHIKNKSKDVNDDFVNLINECNNDTDKYINNQKEYADIVFLLEPLSISTMQENPEDFPQLKLKATLKHGLYYLELQRAFIGLCNLTTNLQLNSELESASIEIEGELDFRGEDATLAIQMICPNMLENLDTKPEWHDGMLGIMQVIILAGINQSLQEIK